MDKVVGNLLQLGRINSEQFSQPREFILKSIPGHLPGQVGSGCWQTVSHAYRRSVRGEDIRLVTTTDAVVDMVSVLEGSGAKGLW
jgi:hypothetical protein